MRVHLSDRVDFGEDLNVFLIAIGDIDNIVAIFHVLVMQMRVQLKPRVRTVSVAVAFFVVIPVLARAKQILFVF